MQNIDKEEMNKKVQTILEKMNKGELPLTEEDMHKEMGKTVMGLLEKVKNGDLPMTNEAKDKKRSQNGLTPPTADDGKKRQAILITAKRQVKERWVPAHSVKECIAQNINTSASDYLEIPCSRLATGVWENRTIRLWYNPHRIGKNSRASKIAGFKIAGEVFIMMDDYDMILEDFITCEKILR